MRLLIALMLLLPLAFTLAPAASASRTCGGLDVPCQVVCTMVFQQAPTDPSGAPSCVEDQVLSPTDAHDVHQGTQCFSDLLDGESC